FYCLNNMPEHMLADEERKLFYAGHYLTYESTDYLEACQELRKAYIYDHMLIYERFKVWDTDFKKAAKDRIIDSVLEARKFMNELYEAHMDGVTITIQLMGLEASPDPTPEPEINLSKPQTI